MLEIDIDGSDDIDFFEYLTVAQMLSNKSGKNCFSSFQHHTHIKCRSHEFMYALSVEYNAW